MNTLYIIASTVFFLWTLRNISFWVALWQLKEYRFDRLFTHVQETKQGKDLLFSPLLFAKIVGIFSFGFVIFNPEFLLSYQIGVTIVFFYLAVCTVQEVLSGQFKRPVVTVKSVLLVLGVLGIVLILYSLPLVDNFFWLLVIDKLIPVIIAVFVFLFSFPTELVHDIIIERAITKIKKHRKLLVIGITGSYGKSSTKEFAAQILARKFNVLKTKGTNNTPIGIARAVLSGLKKETQIFVAEMGAYKKGEISELCKIVFPKIGILTGVNEQHLSLFGNIQNTMKAKYELIESLPKDGLALFNGNNEKARMLYDQTEKKKVLYISNAKFFLNDDKYMKKAIIAQNVKTHKDTVTFDVILKRKILHFTAPVLGAHNVENILPGIYVAKNLGMTNEQIIKAVAAIMSPPKTMTKLSSKNGVILIDDTFNANPQAVLAALQYMKAYAKKRIMVLQPMIELGKNAKQEHFQVAKEISLVCDYLFVTNRNFHGSIAKGIKEGKGKCAVMQTNIDTPEFIEKITSAGDIVVFEGKEASQYLRKFI